MGATDPSFVLAAAIVFIVLCPLFAGLRLYTRVRVTSKASLGIDDWLVLPATLLVIGCAITLIVGVRVKILGSPTPEEDPDFVNFDTFSKIQFAFFLQQILCLGCIKLSLVFFYRRIFCVGRFRSPFEIVSGIVGVIVLLWTIAFFFWFTFSCGRNEHDRWSDAVTYQAHCQTDNMSDIALGISDFLTDLIVLTLPIPMVVKLQMKTKTKLMVLGVFALGLVALIISTLRMVELIYVIGTATGAAGGSESALLPTADANLLLTEALYWSMLEAGLALIACCLPTLNTIFSLPSVRSIIASLRSLQSLGSRRSARKARADDSEPFAMGVSNELRSKPSVGSDSRKESSSTEKRNVNAFGQPSRGSDSRLAIRVEHTISQTESIV